jgi:two-component system, cell cycle sensor histidine kinase and response regulator CckA
MALLMLVATAVTAEPDRVSLQLKYFHQFQFAGYYAADLCGFYQEERLTVDIREWQPGMDLERELIDGRTTFLTYTPLVLERWADGADIFLMAIIHQRNPHVLLVRSDSPWQHLRDITQLPRERLTGPATGMEVDLWIGLSQIGIDPATFFSRRKEPADLQRFIDGQLDVLPGLLSNEPARLRKAGIAVRPLNVLPRTTVTPGDLLVCSGQLYRARPDLVERFRRASLKGWEYALSHPRELIEHILTQRRSAHQTQDADQLAQEAAVTAELIDVDRFPLGSIDLGRLERLADMLRDAGAPGRVPVELVHQPARVGFSWLLWSGLLALTGCLALIVLGLIIRRQRQSLSQTKTHYQNLLDAADGFIAFRAYITGNGGLRFDLASRSIERLLGHPLAWYRLSERSFLDQVHEADRAELANALAEKSANPTGPLRLRLRMTPTSASSELVLMMHATAMPSAQGVALDGVLIDFTSEAVAESQRENLRIQLQSAQRNESLGLLASGVAHDFNNILSAIRGNAELLADHVPQSHRHRMDRLFQAVDRASGLVRQILAYSGRGRVESRPLDLGEELHQIDQLIRHALPKTVRTTLNLESHLPRVMFDPAQFQQVAVNLIVNAAESYNGAAGEVHVLLDQFQDRVRLRVIDQGCGMDQATMARIFDPYFTTKDHGHGLGLAAVQGIIAGVSGSITCDSVPGKGTTFTVLMTPSASSQTRAHASPLPELSDGVQFALVVDDDELVREITVETVTGLGYTCLQADGGLECLRILKEDRQRISLLVLDCRMPDLDGISVLKRIREQGDHLPVVLISGMINVDSISTLLRDRRTKFLAKPFSQNQFSATLDAMFGSQTYHKRDRDSSRTAIMVADVIRQRNEENNRREAGL